LWAFNLLIKWHFLARLITLVSTLQ
jgi:hypothetical protein